MVKFIKIERLILIVLFLFGASVCGSAQAPSDEWLEIALKKYTETINQRQGYAWYPRNQDQSGKIKYVSAGDWTSGFYPGALWYLYEYTEDDAFLVDAQRFTAGIEGQKSNKSTHDLGFMLYCSFGNGYRLTGDTEYKAILLEAAESLASRYNAKIGCIRSWDFGQWEFPVIIDNMMNLELLFWATKNSGDSSFYQKAISHADKTMQNHFRADKSSYHVVDYSKTTGAAISKQTFQGKSDESSWARGQAWGLYGFTMVFKETNEPRFLEHAKDIAAYFVDNLPSDYIPYWDFDVTDVVGQPRDASAAAIAAAAFLDLFSITGEDSYLETAQKIILSLSSDAYFDKEINDTGNLLLKHSTGHFPHDSEIDVALIYADYYYIEALMRLRKIDLEADVLGSNQLPPKELTVYPNPTHQYLKISAESYIQAVVSNLSGQPVLEVRGNSTQLDVSTLASGSYILNLVYPDGHIDAACFIVNHTF